MLFPQLTGTVVITGNLAERDPLERMKRERQRLARVNPRVLSALVKSTVAGHAIPGNELPQPRLDNLQTLVTWVHTGK